MSENITDILAGWAFDPDRVTVRVVKAEDGRELIQLRLDLGLLQMELDGRPDGQRVEEFESLLELNQRRQQDHDAANPDGAPFRLENEDCLRLLREGVQYYHRYLSFWHLRRYELCARDTLRNLRLFAFVREFAKNDQDRFLFDRWRPYVTMMHARAAATPLVELEDYVAAIKVIDAGIAGIEQFLTDYDQTEQADRLGELVFLRRWREELASQTKLIGQTSSGETPKLVDPIVRLQSELDQAVDQERYEDAARLRDELGRLSKPPPPTGLGDTFS